MTVLEALRRPEYTGDRRCWPCTVVNLALVGIAAALVAVRDRRAGLAAGALGAALVWLRGYVVPFTPRFAPALARRLPVAFGHDGDPAARSEGADSLAEDGDSDPEGVLAELVEAGVLVGEEELVLDADFEADWRERMADLRPLDDAALAEAAAAAAPWPATGEPFEDRIRVRGTDGDADAWLTRPVAVGETAAVEALVDAGLSRETAGAAARPLLMFLPECPACGGRVVETTRADCCGATAGSLTPDATVLACDDCGAELFEFEREADAAG